MFLINKPKGITSFDVVREVRRRTGEKRVGHGGTLDKLATGLLVVAVGREFTKQLGKFLKCKKEYVFKAKFGFTSDTLDCDGVIYEVDSKKVFKKDDLGGLISEFFTGEILQVPPKFSALKVAGKRASDRVRKGEEIRLEPRIVLVESFEIVDFKWPFVEFRVVCGGGTYVRALVRDLGEKLGCGGYVVELKRTRVGEYSLNDAVELNEV